MAKINMNELQKRVDAGLISKQKHPEADLYIYNYTAKAQFKRLWDEYTLQARGLILDGQGTIVARPFTKFFNYQDYQNSEMGELPREEYRIYEKLDGSLGILYKLNGRPCLATRGSFVSDQAVTGTKILQERYGSYDFEGGKTYLFEIIYPENRIVVDYKGRSDVVLLAIINTETGQTLDLDGDYPFPIVETFPMQPLDKLLATQRKNTEGFVLQFQPSGLRVKIKHDEYVRLHRLLTGVSSKTIWELLKSGQPLEQILEMVPDEFYNWVGDVEKNLQQQYGDFARDAQAAYNKVKKLPNCREMADKLQADEPAVRAAAFALLDGKDIDQIIWRAIKPTYEQPFRKDIDG